MVDSNTNSDLVPELRGYYDEVLSINQAAEDLLRGLSQAQLLWKPEPRSWSIAQCLDHLNAVSRVELPSVRRAIVEGRTRKLFGHGPYRYGPIGRLLIKVVDENARIRFKAPKAYLPAEATPPADVIRDFFQLQQELLDCIRDANGLDLARTKASILNYKHIRLSLGHDFKMFIVHAQRHLLQAQRIKNALPLSGNN